jgi:hypothetical protein
MARTRVQDLLAASDIFNDGSPLTTDTFGQNTHGLDDTE